MQLKHLSLQNFRSYTKSQFNFSEGTTVIVGPNTAGKTNIIEAIFLLSTGKSFRTEKDSELIFFGEKIARIKGLIEQTELEAVVLESYKKYLVNGVSKRRVDFASNLAVVLFSPLDLEIIIGSPGLRRRFLDDVLEQVDRDYRLAYTSYIKALRQRNALLEQARETERRSLEQFAYWDKLVIGNGQIITQKREELIEFINKEKKEIFNFTVFYDKSIISTERLLQYKDAEVGAGVTLVGPHRDDFSIRMYPNGNNTNEGELKEVKLFGSRGQQRLVVLQLKMLQLTFIEQAIKQRPLLLLDDIFSELDDSHIGLVSKMIDKQQTILTTTHQEFIDKTLLKEVSVIEL